MERYYKKYNFPLQKITGIPVILAVSMINIYQNTLSPDHGLVSLYTIGVCRFRPTCSEYTKQMILKHGVVEGAKKGIKQIKQCH